MSSFDTYKIWRNNDYFDKATREELEKIKDNPSEIEERFYKDLEFGTGGLRGIIGAGTNRMNIYTVRKATQGIASCISQKGDIAKKKGVVIAHDPRRMSREFALEAAKVLAANGIKAYLFDELRPTPELSFAVRFLKASMGINITASHNPKEYNGYKVYGEDGGQLPLEESNIVLDEIGKIQDITSIKAMDEKEALNSGLLEIIGRKIDDEYIARLKTLSINPELVKKVSDKFKIVFTPIHGTGNKLVRRILDEIGFKNVLVVKEQEQPDTEFSTVKSPNPENREAFNIAIELAKKENVDLIIGTDPDCDRVGIIVRDSKNEYVTLSGNQTGCLMLEYILSQKKEKNQLPESGFVVKSIVSTELAKKIAQNYNTELLDVLTGFKFIGEKIKLLDEQGDRKFQFGFEESYGYLAGTFARDKDGVVASMIIAEMAAYYYSRRMSLYDGLQEIYKKYGYFIEAITSYTLEGKEGIEKIKGTLLKLREDCIVDFNGSKVGVLRDYLSGQKYIVLEEKREPLDLPKSDVLYYEMQDGSWFCIRPSGTEPKIKIYFGVSDSSKESADNKLNVLKENVLEIINKLLK